MIARTPNNVKQKTEFEAHVCHVRWKLWDSFWYKSSVLSWCLNVDKDDDNVRRNGRLFQVLAAAT